MDKPTTHGTRILHLEDDPFDAELIYRELKKELVDFEIKVVANRNQFESAVVNYHPDIILSDHSLPSFDSIQALEIALSHAPGIPFILVTATISEEFAVSMIHRGASDYILKHHLNRLPSAVTNAIEKSNIRKQKNIAETELKISYQQVRKLASHLQNVREEERSNIAREIHDELGQQLTGIKLDLLWLMLKSNDFEQEVKDRLAKLETMLNACLKTVKRVATDLHPALLHKLGVVEAIKWQTKEFRERTGIRVDLDLPETDLQLKEQTAIALYRIYQESLTNVARHSGAKHVACSLKKIQKRLLLSVKDDGRGFDLKVANAMNSLGLLGMSERTSMIGGEYRIDSAPGSGTSVLVDLPFH